MTLNEPAPTGFDRALTAGTVVVALGAIILHAGHGRASRVLFACALLLLALKLVRNAFRARAGLLPWGRLALPGLLLVEGAASLAHVGPRGLVVKGTTAVLLEMGLLWLAWRAWKDRAGAQEGLPEARLAHRLQSFLGPRASHLVALELVVLSGAIRALLGRGRKIVDANAFTYHRESVLGALLLALPVMAIGDLLLLDLVLRHAAPWLRWTIHAVDLYGLLWILGLWQSMRDRPHRLDDEALWVHRGVLGSLRIPRLLLGQPKPLPFFDDPAARKAFLGDAANLGVSGGSEFLLELTEPLRPMGFLGLGPARKRVLLTVDDPGTFLARMGS
ncbi:MAG: hypothetical protein IPN59_11325 [Holophaga sp.]|nr:hypothetical protein [Holophaga sp.]